MKITEDFYSFEIPERWANLVGAIKKKSRVDIVLLWEADTGCSGILVSLKCLKHKIKKPDEYTELLGILNSEAGDRRFLYASYGREGAVSEGNEDLYWRLRDQLWMIFDSINPADGYNWQCN